MIPEGSHWVDNSVYHPQPSQVPGFPSTPTPEAAFEQTQNWTAYNNKHLFRS